MSNNTKRQYSLIDQYLIGFDQAVRTVFGRPHEQRPNPADDTPEMHASLKEKKQSAALMRVNHAGEVSAQALYQAQALTATSAVVAQKMKHAAEEENDHLAWCKDRIDELGDRTSRLNPFWYLGSFAIGTAAGLIGDKWNLGFLAETEKQVVKHLDNHLEKLPEQDKKSREIVTQMREDEAKHAGMAIENGGAELPPAAKKLMTLFSKFMTRTAYWI